MRRKQATEIFNVVKAKKMLPANLEELVPLSFIGQTAVGFYRERIKLMDKLNMTEAQRQATLRDGQDAGEMLLDIESRIGDLALKEKPAKSKAGGKGGGATPSGERPKHERLGMDRKKMVQSQQIAKHPEIVERVKAQAKENEDIPTKTAVLAEIKFQRIKKRDEEAKKQPKQPPPINKFAYRLGQQFGKDGRVAQGNFTPRLPQIRA